MKGEGVWTYEDGNVKFENKILSYEGFRLTKTFKQSDKFIGLSAIKRRILRCPHKKYFDVMKNRLGIDKFVLKQQFKEKNNNFQLRLPDCNECVYEIGTTTLVNFLKALGLNLSPYTEYMT